MINESYEKLTNREKEQFALTANKLLNQTFVTKENNTKEDYYFVRDHIDLMQEYFAMIGYDLIIIGDAGVAQLKNTASKNKLRLTIFETIILVVLQALYVKKRSESLKGTEVVVTGGEIEDYLKTLKIKKITKTAFKNAIQKLKKFNLFTPIDDDVTKTDSRFRIYQTVMFSVDIDNFEIAKQSIRDRLTNLCRNDCVNEDTYENEVEEDGDDE